jgi:hypothetical protein
MSIYISRRTWILTTTVGASVLIGGVNLAAAQAQEKKETSATANTTTQKKVEFEWVKTREMRPSADALAAFTGGFVSWLGAFYVNAADANGVFVITDATGTFAYSDKFTFLVAGPSGGYTYYVYTGTDYEFAFPDIPPGDSYTVGYRKKGTLPWYPYGSMTRYEKK